MYSTSTLFFIILFSTVLASMHARVPRTRVATMDNTYMHIIVVVCIHDVGCTAVVECKVRARTTLVEEIHLTGTQHALAF